MSRSRSKAPLGERLNRRIDKSGPGSCWLWTGRKIGNHGFIHDVRGGKKIVRSVSAVAWALANDQPIPEGHKLIVSRSCANKLCCNPEHLSLGKANRSKKPRRPLADRFNEHVDRSRGPKSCWPWLRPLQMGYGHILTYDENGKRRRSGAHVVAWALANDQPIPTSVHNPVCHACNNRGCVNPAHLYLGTPGSNMRDAVRAGTHAGWRARRSLSPSQVRRIRKLWASGEWSQRAIAKKFNVSPRVIGSVLGGETYQDVK